MGESGSPGDEERAVAELQRRASSSDWAERAEAGAGLVAFADRSALQDLLIRLLLDEEDTAVTQAVSEALLARADRAALRLYARGFHLADSDQSQDFGDPTRLVESRPGLWNELSTDADENVASGAREVLRWVQPHHKW